MGLRPYIRLREDQRLIPFVSKTAAVQNLAVLQETVISCSSIGYCSMGSEHYKTERKLTFMINEKYLEKANVLIEALPYIQRFNRKIIVIKYGGSAMLDDELMKHVIEDAVLLKLVGFKPVVVHGGGREISRWTRKAGIEPRFVDGLRVTDEDTLEVAEMVLGKVNQDLVTLAQRLGVRACGISGKDGRLLTVKKNMPGGQEPGDKRSIKITFKRPTVQLRAGLINEKISNSKTIMLIVIILHRIRFTNELR